MDHVSAQGADECMNNVHYYYYYYYYLIQKLLVHLEVTVSYNLEIGRPDNRTVYNSPAKS